ncbi:MAG: fibro-slime domain-containing protein [Chitinispirillaceae bacterium]|nr:fibro-slime domain-containing protein [Chitinispirillaceae bacterium]
MFKNVFFNRKLMLGLFLSGLFSSSAFSQDFEFIIRDTLWVKVTFYDFHQNTNFGDGNCGTATGMVQDTLDNDRKPLLQKDRCSNDLLAQWFRPSGGVGATFMPFLGTWNGLVNYKGNSGEYTGVGFNTADPMANVVIYDSLPFNLVDSATGTYTFSRTNKAPGGGFFWLDGRGFGEEPAGSGHNFYFTMELHKEFIYKGGETFSFSGDDDVWVFINGELALDLGGMQAETRRELVLDDEADKLGLVKGEKYPLDFFYTERRHPQSNCEITTNLLTPVRPHHMIVTTSEIPPNPETDEGLFDTTMIVGTTVPLYIYIFDADNNLRTDYLDLIYWRFKDQQGNLIRADTAGHKIDFTMPDIERCVYIFQAFDDPADSIPVAENYIRICPIPGTVDTTDTTTTDTTVTDTTTTDTTTTDTTVTDTTTTDTTTIDTTTTPPDTTAQEDLFGAIVKEVIYYPGTGNATLDTLRIMLTEPVECATINEGAVKDIFILNDGGTENADALADARLVRECESIGMMVTSVTMTIPYKSIVITPETDSLVLAEETPYVVDTKGDVPPQDMKPVVIKWGRTGITVAAQPNPASPDKPVSQGIRDNFIRNFTEVPQKGGVTYTGTVVGVQTIKPFVVMEDPPASAGTGDVYGLANVYDVVGNLVAEQLPLKLSIRRGVYGVYWNMRNRAQRQVGTGVYLIMITAKMENSKKPVTIKAKIGVK